MSFLIDYFLELVLVLSASDGFKISLETLLQRMGPGYISSGSIFNIFYRNRHVHEHGRLHLIKRIFHFAFGSLGDATSEACS